MEIFIPALSGTLLGVSLPFIIRAISDKINFQKLINTLFIQYDAYNQHIKLRSVYVLNEANRSWSTFLTDSRETLLKNFDMLIDCSELLLNQYSKYLRAVDIFHLIKDKQNITIFHNTLINSNYQMLNDLQSTLNNYQESLIKRTWTLYCIAKRKDISFSIDKYNLLTQHIYKFETLRITSIRI